MTQRLQLEWPDPRAFRGRDGRPIRILAVSDALEQTLVDARTREQLRPIDLILGCGDLHPEDLGFIADGIGAPLLFVRGNHDGDARWEAGARQIPASLKAGAIVHTEGVTIAALPWPGKTGRAATASPRSAWKDVLSIALRRLFRRDPLIVISHVPPLGVGDVATDSFHRGQKGYRWLLDRIGPRLWLHGHTPLAACAEWRIEHEGTTVLNVTGAVLIELCPPGTAAPEADAGARH